MPLPGQCRLGWTSIGSHFAYHTDPQGNQNYSVTQERLQIFGNEIRTNRSRGVLENKILSEARRTLRKNWMSLLYGQYFKQILQHNLSVSFGSRVLIKFLRLVFELVEGWSIANSPRLVEGWAIGGCHWLAFFLQKRTFSAWFTVFSAFPKNVQNRVSGQRFFGRPCHGLVSLLWG